MSYSGISKNRRAKGLGFFRYNEERYMEVVYHTFDYSWGKEYRSLYRLCHIEVR